MNRVDLNTVCPVCGAAVPESMPPMEVVHTSHLDDRGIPMLRVCCAACAKVVNHEPDLYYRAARTNSKANTGVPR
jgi:predicted nucleic acid-binding Zn ribbon protein